MKKAYKILLGIVVLIVTGIALTGAYVKGFLPDVKIPEDISIEPTLERIERGKYLANNVTVCMDCHSSRNWAAFAGPLAGNPGGGGEKFGREMGFPGEIYSPNITPYNLGSWTDGEVYRAITSGVGREGNALFPVMPYHHYGQMSREDIYSIIAYIRTLDPIESTTPERELDFPVNFLVNTMPKESKPGTMPDINNRLAYGAYVINAAGCVDCHSKTNKGAIIKGTEFGGGMEFMQPAGIVRSPNITPDMNTGIGKWTIENFVQRFKEYTDSSYQSPVYTKDDLNSPMPWHMYAGMKVEDLEAIFIYLQSLQPIDNAVSKFERKN